MIKVGRRGHFIEHDIKSNENPSIDKILYSCLKTWSHSLIRNSDNFLKNIRIMGMGWDKCLLHSIFSYSLSKISIDIGCIRLKIKMHILSSLFKIFFKKFQDEECFFLKNTWFPSRNSNIEFFRGKIWILNFIECNSKYFFNTRLNTEYVFIFCYITKNTSKITSFPYSNNKLFTQFLFPFFLVMKNATIENVFSRHKVWILVVCLSKRLKQYHESMDCHS